MAVVRLVVFVMIVSRAALSAQSVEVLAERQAAISGRVDAILTEIHDVKGQQATMQVDLTTMKVKLEDLTDIKRLVYGAVVTLIVQFVVGGLVAANLLRTGKAKP